MTLRLSQKGRGTYRFQPVKSKADLQRVRKKLKAKRIPFQVSTLKNWKYGVIFREKLLRRKMRKK